MFYSDDPARDFDRWDQELERRRARRPECSHCGERIQDEEAYYINGEFICPKCMENEFKVLVENYIDE